MKHLASLLTPPRRLSRILLAGLVLACSPFALAGQPEKQELKFGFIKLTDCAPLIVAYEKGFFEEEGLYVTLEAQANWKLVLDRVIDGSLDGSHMLPGQALGAAVGFGTQAELITPVAMGINTLAVTVGRDVWASMKTRLPVADGAITHPIGSSELKPVIASYRDANRPFAMAMVFPTSTHNYHLRYWLAAGGINPGFYTASDANGQADAEVLLSVTPPPQMPATLESGTIAGFSVGEPWNQQAVIKDIGVPVITAQEIWQRTPEKVFGMRADFAAKNPETTKAIVRALIRAALWLDADNGANRQELAAMLSRPDYVGADESVLLGPLTGTYQYEKGDIRPQPRSNLYFREYASYPFRSDAVWFLTQMRRWGQIGEAKPDAWYQDVANRVYRPDLYQAAAEELVAKGAVPAEGLMPTDREVAPAAPFIDGVDFDAHLPNAYLAKLAIGLKDEAAKAPALAAAANATPPASK